MEEGRDYWMHYCYRIPGADWAIELVQTFDETDTDHGWRLRTNIIAGPPIVGPITWGYATGSAAFAMAKAKNATIQAIAESGWFESPDPD